MSTSVHLHSCEHHWKTNMGAWFPGERVVLRGKDIFHDLNDYSWMKLLLYGITGKSFSDKQLELFEGIWTLCTSYPDPRLWNNQVAALAGTARSTMALGMSASIAVSEAIIYGFRPLVASQKLLHLVHHRCQHGEKLDDVVTDILATGDDGRPGAGKNRTVARLPGYGRPIVHGDERIKPLMSLARRLGYDKGDLVTIAFEIEESLQTRGSSLRMNIAALMGALTADQGMSSREYYFYMIQCFSAGIIPSAISTFEQTEGSFFPARCTRIHYQGYEQRQWISRTGTEM